MAGLFIAFEGIDGCGKTTQLRRLAASLEGNGRRVLITREPGGTSTGELIRRVVLGVEGGRARPRTTAMLMNAARLEHVETLIRPTLEGGTSVLSDRFAASTVAYQGGGQGVDPIWLEQLEVLATGGLKPDVYIFLDIDPAMAPARLSERSDANYLDQEAVQFFARVRRIYQALAARAPDRWLTVDASGSIDEVSRRVEVALAERIDHIDARVTS